LHMRARPCIPGQRGPQELDAPGSQRATDGEPTNMQVPA
jgi:hypothetical protein